MFSFKDRPEVYLEGNRVMVVPPLGDSAHGKLLALLKQDIPELVKRYVAAVETQTTNEWCRCEWIIHPDDAEIPDNACRNCGADKDAEVHSDNGHHDYRGKRMRKIDEAEDCPVHTKEGFLLYFFEWVFTHEGD